jgi:CubicO group peptidase (beta-lactamase class C family)
MDSVAGVWGCDVILGPELRGALVVRREDEAWRASVGGFDAVGASHNGTRSFVFPGGRGELRIAAPVGNGAMEGHWIQPGGAIDTSAYATPLLLDPIGEGAWRGEVVPLDDRISMYLSLGRQDGGSLSAFLRDPLRNAGVSLPLTGATAEGSDLLLLPRQGDPIRCDVQNGTLAVTLPLYPFPLVFTRRDENSAPGFYPRTPNLRYAYRQPTGDKDGWQTGTLRDAGLAEEPIAEMVQTILSTQTTGLTTPYIHSLLVARYGKLVLDEYFYGFGSEQPHDMRSASKTLAGTLAGIAMDQGAPLSVNTPVRSLFPQYGTAGDPRKEQITIGHLLTMTSGLACNDYDDDSPGNEDTMQSQGEQPDWYRFTLDLPMSYEPGEHAAYCSGGMNLVGGAISSATGAWLPDFFREYLAGPLDFGRYHLQLTPTGNLYLGGGSYLRPRDFLKLGQAYLDGGRWHDRQVVSAEWVERSLRHHSTMPGPDEYGYGWHLNTYTAGGRGYRVAEAAGNGGQIMGIIPELGIAYMFTGGNYGNFPTWNGFRKLISDYLIPAVQA